MMMQTAARLGKDKLQTWLVLEGVTARVQWWNSSLLEMCLAVTTGTLFLLLILFPLY